MSTQKKYLVIFCGGKSTRMGQNKALMSFGQREGHLTPVNNLEKFKNPNFKQLFDEYVYIFPKHFQHEYIQFLNNDYHWLPDPGLGIWEAFLEFAKHFSRIGGIYSLATIDTPLINENFYIKSFKLYNQFFKKNKKFFGILPQFIGPKDVSIGVLQSTVSNYFLLHWLNHYAENPKPLRNSFKACLECVPFKLEKDCESTQLGLNINTKEEYYNYINKNLS